MAISKSDYDKVMAEIVRLKAENAALAAAKSKAKPFGLKVSDKGGVSVYGLGRFPVTLYKDQWERLLDHSDEIRAFLADNAGKLATK